MPSLEDYLSAGDFAHVKPGFPRYDDGTYKFNVQEIPTVVSEKTSTPYLDLQMVCAEGPTQATGESPVGRPAKDRLYLSKPSLWRVKACLISGGRLSRDDETSDMAQGKMGPDAFVGMVINVKMSTREGADPVTKIPTGKFYNDYEYLTD